MAEKDDRTMFITFSRGFTMPGAEVKEFFTREYGENCVESVSMAEEDENALNTNTNTNGLKPLFGKMVLDSVTTMDRILNGEKIRRFRINEKFIWVRKYVPRPAFKPNVA